MIFFRAMDPPLASLRSTANPPVNSASMMWLFCKEPRTSGNGNRATAISAQTTSGARSSSAASQRGQSSGKNSLQVVASMLHLQANAAGNSELTESLDEAASRISTVGRAYDRLAYAADYEKIDLITYLSEVLKDLERAVSPNVIHFVAPPNISILADRAILIGLIINELVSNAGKYAYPDRPADPSG